MKTVYKETTVYPDTLVFKEAGGVLNAIITMNIEESQKDFSN